MRDINSLGKIYVAEWRCNFSIKPILKNFTYNIMQFLIINKFLHAEFTNHKID